MSCKLTRYEANTLIMGIHLTRPRQQYMLRKNGQILAVELLRCLGRGTTWHKEVRVSRKIIHGQKRQVKRHEKLPFTQEADP